MRTSVWLLEPSSIPQIFNLMFENVGEILENDGSLCVSLMNNIR